MLLRNPCKNLKPYVMPLWDVSNGTNKKKKKRTEKKRGEKFCAAELMFGLVELEKSY